FCDTYGAAEAAPLQSKVKTRGFPQTVKPCPTQNRFMKPPLEITQPASFARGQPKAGPLVKSLSRAATSLVHPGFSPGDRALRLAPAPHKPRALRDASSAPSSASPPCPRLREPAGH